MVHSTLHLVSTDQEHLVPLTLLISNVNWTLVILLLSMYYHHYLSAQFMVLTHKHLLLLLCVALGMLPHTVSLMLPSHNLGYKNMPLHFSWPILLKFLQTSNHTNFHTLSNSLQPLTNNATNGNSNLRVEVCFIYF